MITLISRNTTLPHEASEVMTWNSIQSANLYIYYLVVCYRQTHQFIDVFRKRWGKLLFRAADLKYSPLEDFFDFQNSLQSSSYAAPNRIYRIAASASSIVALQTSPFGNPFLEVKRNSCVEPRYYMVHCSVTNCRLCNRLTYAEYLPAR
jgi:hypothetical protein